jgi:hypothetical protein
MDNQAPIWFEHCSRSVRRRRLPRRARQHNSRAQNLKLHLREEPDFRRRECRVPPFQCRNSRTGSYFKLGADPLFATVNRRYTSQIYTSQRINNKSKEETYIPLHPHLFSLVVYLFICSPRPFVVQCWPC